MPETSQKAIDNVTINLHRASLAPELWPSVMDELSALFGGRPIMYGVQWVPAGISFMNATGIPSEALSVLVNQFSSVDANPAAKGLEQALQPHEPIKIYSVLNQEDLHSTEYYQRTIDQMGGVIGDLALASAMSQTRVTATVLMRKLDQEPAGEPEVDLLRRLSPHLGHAMEVMVRLGRLSAGQKAMSQVLCQVAQPVALLDSERQLVFANPAFEDMLAESAVLGIDRGRLACRHKAYRREFELFVDGLIKAENERPGSRTFTLAPNAAATGVTLIGQHVTDDFANDLELGQTRAILFVSTTGTIRNDLVALMAERFRLSKQQTTVLRHVVDGLDGPQIAERLAITPNTLKTHMNRIYDKTQTGSREELFKCLITLSTQSPRLLS